MWAIISNFEDLVAVGQRSEYGTVDARPYFCRLQKAEGSDTAIRVFQKVQVLLTLYAYPLVIQQESPCQYSSTKKDSQ